MWGGGPFHGPLSLSLPLSLPLRLYLNWLAQRLENPMVNLCAVQTGFTSNILLTPLGGVVRTRSLSRCRRPPARSDTFLAVCGRKASAQENCLRLAHPKDHPVHSLVRTTPPRAWRMSVCDPKRRSCLGPISVERMFRCLGMFSDLKIVLRTVCTAAA